MLTIQRGEAGVRLGREAFRATPAELAALVLAALGWNAFGYGAALLLAGGGGPWPLGLLLAGGAVGLGSAGWLAVVYHVRDIVSGPV